jgi:preprotein translocase subunit SecA
LAILGTERHESRRIDLQLRGRAGRQGDPGESQFFVSLEDDLMQLFGSDRVANVMDRLNFEEGEVIQHSWITKSLERAQKKVEQNNFSIRKKQLEYDDVLNNQRNVIYKRREHALSGDQLRNDIYDMLEELIEKIVEQHFEEGELDQIRERTLRNLAVDLEVDREAWMKMGENGLIEHIMDRAIETYNQKEDFISEPVYNLLQQFENADDDEFVPEKIQVVFTDGIRRLRVIMDVKKALKNKGHEVARALERTAMLSTIDDKWMEHLRELDSVKEGIGLRAFGQKDPLLEYKREAFDMFKQLLDEINEEVISLIWKAVPEVNEGQQPKEAQKQKSKVDMNQAKSSHEDSTNMGMKFGGGNGQEGGQMQQAETSDSKPEPVTVADEPGRNDPCPCGSGKKYKHCHGR